MELNAVGDLVVAEPEAFHALADPFRLALLDRLRRCGPATTPELADALGTRGPPGCSTPACA